MSLDLSVVVELLGIHTKNLDLTVVRDPVRRIYQYDLTDGSGDLQASRLFHALDEFTDDVATGAQRSFDLIGSTHTDAFGDALAFSRIKGIVIRADDDNPGDLAFGPGAIASAADAFVGPWGGPESYCVVQPGGLWAAVAPDLGWPIVEAADQLYVDTVSHTGQPASTSYAYDLWVWGV